MNDNTFYSGVNSENVMAISPVLDEIFNLKPQLCQHYMVTAEKKSSKSVTFLVSGPRPSVQNLLTIHPIDAKIF